MKIEYIFKHEGVIHVIQCKPSENTKIGIFSLVIQTYHISEEQLSDFSNDQLNCLDCPYSYNMNEGKSGGCYTHKGLQGVGIKSMVRRLSKLNIDPFDSTSFNSYIQKIAKFPIQLCRLGAYGEPCLLPLNVIEALIKTSKTHTGYTHQWNKEEYKDYSKYLMASTHNSFETSIANDMGFRAFESNKVKEKTVAICPASKEFKGNKKTCVECAACCGTVSSKKSNIFIYKH